MDSKLSGNLTFFKKKQPLKADFPIRFTELGMNTDSKPVKLKVLSRISVKSGGRFTLRRLEQLEYLQVTLYQRFVI